MDNENKIINYLGKNLRKRYTMHELSKILKIPYASFYRTVQRMQDLLVIEVVGKAKTIRLDLDNSVIKAHLIIASDEERKEFVEHVKVKEFGKEDVVILIGKKTHVIKEGDFKKLLKDGWVVVLNNIEGFWRGILDEI
jgi:hypothetical protein